MGRENFLKDMAFRYHDFKKKGAEKSTHQVRHPQCRQRTSVGRKFSRTDLVENVCKNYKKYRPPQGK